MRRRRPRAPSERIAEFAETVLDQVDARVEQQCAGASGRSDCTSVSPGMTGPLLLLRDFPGASAFVAARPRVQRLIANVLEGPGTSAPGLRQAAALGGALPAPLRAYLDKLSRHAFRITDEDFAGLIAGGTSEDDLLELSVAGALGAALIRLERGLAAARRPEE